MPQRESQGFGEPVHPNPSKQRALEELKRELSSYQRRLPDSDLAEYVQEFETAIQSVETGRPEDALRWLTVEKNELQEHIEALKEGLQKPLSQVDADMRATFTRELEESTNLLGAIHTLLQSMEGE